VPLFRDIGKEEFGEWKKLYQAARTSQRNREEETDAVAELIEKKLVLIGCTAIEDKLQPGVPQSILALMQAGIKLWVLTGNHAPHPGNIHTHTHTHPFHGLPINLASTPAYC
jgi:phospholipid-transporting ATPase